MSEPVEDLGHLPHASKVEAMAGYGLTPADIARVLDIDVEELKASYSKELAGGQIKANARVAESLYRKAIGEGRESVIAAIFWLKTRARWREISVHEHVAAQEQITISENAEFIRRALEGAEQFTAKIIDMVARTESIDNDCE
jgi:hypothetical protein